MNILKKHTSPSFCAVASVALAMSLPVSGMANTLPGELSFTSVLSKSAEVGHVIKSNTPKDVTGKADFSYDTISHKLRFTIHYAHLSGRPTMAHFHLGAVGTNGPVIQTICGKPAPSLLGACPALTSSQLSGEWVVPAKYQSALMKNDIFINFHTDLNPKGELRGQLEPKSS